MDELTRIWNYHVAFPFVCLVDFAEDGYLGGRGILTFIFGSRCLGLCQNVGSAGHGGAMTLLDLGVTLGGSSEYGCW